MYSKTQCLGWWNVNHSYVVMIVIHICSFMVLVVTCILLFAMFNQNELSKIAHGSDSLDKSICILQRNQRNINKLQKLQVHPYTFHEVCDYSKKIELGIYTCSCHPCLIILFVYILALPSLLHSVISFINFFYTSTQRHTKYKKMYRKLVHVNVCHKPESDQFRHVHMTCSALGHWYIGIPTMLQYSTLIFAVFAD